MWPTVWTLIYHDLCKYCRLNPRYIYIIQTTRVPPFLFMLLEVTLASQPLATSACCNPGRSLLTFLPQRERPGNTCSFYPLLPTFCYTIAWYLVQRSKIWKTQQLPEAWPRSHGASSNTRQHGMRASISRDESLIHKALPYRPDLFPFTIRAVGQTASWTTLQKPPWVPLRIFSLGGESCFILRSTWIVLSKADASKSLQTAT